MKTEQEAKECWCPFARVVYSGGDGGCNRLSDGDAALNSFCVASACMAWRQTDFISEGHNLGYCGLAGQPFGPVPKGK